MGIMALLTPPYLLSAQEAFATKSDDDYQGKKHDDSKIQKGYPTAYIAIDGELSELQLENGPFSDEDSIADYDKDPQGTLSFGEHFSLLVPQAPGNLKDVESAQLYVNDDVLNQNDYLQTDIELVDTSDSRYLYFETYLNDVQGGRRPRCFRRWIYSKREWF